MSVSARERCCFVGDPFAGVGVERPTQSVEPTQSAQTEKAPDQPVGQTQAARVEATQPPQQEETSGNQYRTIGRGGYFVPKSGV